MGPRDLRATMEVSTQRDSRLYRLLPLSGIAAVLLVLATHLVHGGVPSAHAPLSDVVGFFRKHGDRHVLGAYLIQLAALCLLVFATTLRRATGRSVGESVGTTLGFAGAILFCVGLTALAGIGFALGDAPDKLTPQAIQALNALYNDLFAPMTVGIAAFLIGGGISAMRSGVLPGWLGWTGVVFGIVSLTPAGLAAVLALGLWLVAAAVLMARDAGGAVREGE